MDWKLQSVLHALMAIRLNSLSFWKKFSMRCRHLHFSGSWLAGWRRLALAGMTASMPRCRRTLRSQSASYALSARKASKLSPSNNAATPVISPRCPGIRRKRTRLPSASTMAKIFVVRPPRLLPMDCFLVPLLPLVRGDERERWFHRPSHIRNRSPRIRG